MNTVAIPPDPILSISLYRLSISSAVGTSPGYPDQPSERV